jgi:SEC-C motif
LEPSDYSEVTCWNNSVDGLSNNTVDTPHNTPRVERADGVTHAERYLKQLCDKTFLSLWSFPGVYRDQGHSGKGDGKEECDLLVVFENDIIIFSDKSCEFPRTDNLERDWCRWFRKAVLQSATQVWGAERWIKTFPNRLFLDRSCQVPFPIDIPDIQSARFHRIVVAHNASKRCTEALGQSGSLMLMPRIVGDAHCDPDKGTVIPFAIGHVDPQRGFVHVLDDMTLEVLLGTLDTVRDFVNYLTKKERFITSGLLVAATGEEELLGHYLAKLNKQGEHDFVFPEDVTAIAIDVGFWDDFKNSPERRRHQQANEVSYTWDRIIEKFGFHIFGGTSRSNSHPRIADQVVPLRFMARERRTRRRILSKALIDLLSKTENRNLRATRIVSPSNAGDPYYVFLVLSKPDGVSDNEYRDVRYHLLAELCRSAKLQFADALDIVGFATEPGLLGDKTEDVIYMDARHWTPEDQQDAEQVRDDLKLLKEVTMSKERHKEYPDSPKSERTVLPPRRKRPQSRRNSMCPCGSGRKFKKCCGP